MVKEKGKGRRGGFAPTVQQINADILTQVANTYWAPHRNHLPYDPKVIDKIYEKDLLGCSFSIQRVMLLEFSQYLENYLWPNFNADQASLAHTMSIVVMVNEKFRESVPPWEIFKSKPEQFPGFFRHVLDISLLEESVTIKEKVVILRFLIHCFSSLETDVIREQVQQLVSLPMWSCLLP
ncbi:intron-binding aquarius-like, partial [Paramuricea clavata]